MRKNQAVILGTAGLLGILAAITATAARAVSILGCLTAAGEGLRALSLSGTPGNLAAWCIVYLFSAPPILWMAWQWRSREKCPADLLAVLSSLLIFGGLFALVNPSCFQAPAPQISAVFPLSFWISALSVLVCWLVLLVLKRLNGASFQLLCRALAILLLLAAALLAFSAFYTAASGCVLAYQVGQDGSLTDLNIALFGVDVADMALGQNSALFIIILVFLQLIPDLLGAVVLLWGADFVDAVQQEPFGEATVALCEKIARGCQRVVQWSVGLAVCSNLIQLLMLSQVSQTSFSLHLPLFTLLLSAALLLLCRCFQRGKALQEDNDSII